MYDITPRFDHRYLDISCAGWWSAAVIRDYREDLRRMTAFLNARGGYRGALFDATDYPIQSPDVARGHGEAMLLARTLYGVRAAVVMGGRRSQLQMRRLTADSGQRLFANRADALDWLCG